MRNLIPFCPNCGECKVILSPLQMLTVGELRMDPDRIPVACSQCTWRGQWREVVYKNV